MVQLSEAGSQAMSPAILAFRCVIGLSLIALAGHVGGICVSLYQRSGSLGCPGRGVGRALRGIASTTLRFWRGETADKQVHDTVQLRRTHRIRNFSSAVAAPVALMVIVTLVQFRLYDFTSPIPVERPEKEIYESPFVMLVLGYSCLVAVEVFPDAWTTFIADVSYFVIFGWLAWRVGWETNVVRLAAGSTMHVTLRFGTYTVIGNKRLTFLLNTLLSSYRMLKYMKMMEGLSAEEVAEADRFLGAGHMMNTFNTELLILSQVFVAASINEEQLVAEIRATLDAIKWSESSQNVMSLLSLICNAVVTTSRDFLLTTPSMDLAGFLLRAPPNNSYTGAQLLDLVAELDRAKVKRQLGETCTSPGASTTLSAHMVDGNQTSIRVQLYCSCVRLPEKRIGYIMGIVESSMSEGRMHHETLTRDLYPYREAGPGVVLVRKDEKSISVNSNDNVSNAPSSVPSGVHASAIIEEREQKQQPRRQPPDAQATVEAWLAKMKGTPEALRRSLPPLVVGNDSDEIPEVTVNAQSPNLPIIKCNVAFQELVGKKRLVSLVKLLYDACVFLPKVQSLVRAVHDGEMSASRIKVGTVKIVAAAVPTNPSGANGRSDSCAAEFRDYEHYYEATCVVDLSLVAEAVEQNRDMPMLGQPLPLLCELHNCERKKAERAAPPTVEMLATRLASEAPRSNGERKSAPIATRLGRQEVHSSGGYEVLQL
eukprot:TRINITY_DN30896_c0_g1_i2.p1 TRINITY_DN30896_c0_g1~~TRINITY_DN30896_c0_g1_i2.p1  ORF type:complete len:710 (+),score=125.01 TRINITY_DN30896_c0_g1_i2:197-2326(+)